MNNTTATCNMLWSAWMVDELLRLGIDTFYLAPGSRCAPLTLAVADAAEATVIRHFDERGAAFAAMGYGMARGKPAVLVTTSGTAVANALPAVIEAAMSHVPLLLLTADRPPELRDTAANQTIDQVRIFGTAVRWFFDVPCPGEDMDPAALLTTIDEAVARCATGPVHVNCMFREPLVPDPCEEPPAHLVLRAPSRWVASRTPHTVIAATEPAAAAGDVAEVRRIAAASVRGIIVCGSMAPGEATADILALSRALQWPVLADITANLRLRHADAGIIDGAAQIAGQAAFPLWQEVDAVLQLGGRLVSKNVMERIAERRPAEYVVVSRLAGRQDPLHRVTRRLQCAVPVFCRQLLEGLGSRTDGAWRAAWQQAGAKVAAELQRFVGEREDIIEPAIASQVAACIPDGHALFLGNSMPVRDMDLFALRHGGDVVVGSNRGASGIDGNIAAATGFAVGSGRPCTLVLGDLAALHDLNSLRLLAECPRPVTLVIVNNDGGGVFSFLPVARRQDVLELNFATPHGLGFADVARMFGLRHAAPRTLSEFEALYRAAVAADRSSILEVRTERAANHALHRDIAQRVAGVLR